MPETTSHLTISHTDRAVLAQIRCEKVGSRESQIIETDLRTAAPSRQWRVVVDLSEVTLLASMGLGMLVHLHKTCAQEGGKLAICGVRPELQQLLKVTHLDRVLKVASDRDAALASVR